MLGKGNPVGGAWGVWVSPCRVRVSNHTVLMWVVRVSGAFWVGESALFVVASSVEGVASAQAALGRTCVRRRNRTQTLTNSFTRTQAHTHACGRAGLRACVRMGERLGGSKAFHGRFSISNNNDFMQILQPSSKVRLRFACRSQEWKYAKKYY